MSRIDFMSDEAVAERFEVILAETGEPIQDVAWADPEAGIYATVKSRQRTMSDPPGVDLRIRSETGNFALKVHRAEIELIDRKANPLKAEFLALLDDPEVIAKLKHALTAG